MHIAVWIVTEISETGSSTSVHFVAALSMDRARDLVARRIRVRPERLSVVPLWIAPSPVSQSQRKRPDLERYLGPLEQYSPVLREACSFCRGIGLVIGSRPPERCPPCGGSGLKTTRI